MNKLLPVKTLARLIKPLLFLLLAGLPLLSDAQEVVYSIELNGPTHQTAQSQVFLSLKEESNLLRVYADKLHQGTIEKNIQVSRKVVVYPNPFEGTLFLDNINSRKANVEVNSLSGTRVFSQSTHDGSTRLPLDLSNLAPGIYLLKISLDDSESIFKIIKK